MADDDDRQKTGSAGGKPDEDFAAMFAESERAGLGHRKRRRLAAGERVRGKIVSVGREVAFIELDGGAGNGMLDLAELRNPDGSVTVAVGDAVEALVAEDGGGEGGGAVTLRRSLVRGGDAHARLEQAFQLGLPVEGTVTAVNKGGVDVDLGGTRAFCPISQLELRHVEDASAYIGRKLPFRITRVEEDRRGLNVVVSRRAQLEDDARALAAETRGKLTVGAIVPGVVTALKDYGAFVDLGGVEGMLHVSEIGFQRVARPADVLSVGQTITVQILRMERKPDGKGTQPGKQPGKQSGNNDGKEQIALSLKSLEADPWQEAGPRLSEGARVRGTVARVTPFGAFVELSPGVDGLLHISELSEGGRSARHSREALKPGDAVEVTIKAIDRAERRVSLALAGPDESLDAEGRAAADRAAGPGGAGNGAREGKLGTLGDLLKAKPAQPRRSGR